MPPTKATDSEEDGSEDRTTTVKESDMHVVFDWSITASDDKDFRYLLTKGRHGCIRLDCEKYRLRR